MIKRISLLVLLMIFSNTAFSQDREGRWETSFVLNYQNSMDETFKHGSALDVDSSVGWGFTVGYNLTSNWNLSYKFMANKPDYTAVIVPDEVGANPEFIDHQMSVYSNQFNLTYNFMQGPVTPYVVGGLGWTRLDSNLADGPPQTGCWWDPWWGYICYTDWKTFDTSEFTYNLGAGVRWDVNDAVYTKAAYSREFMDLKGGSLDFDTFSLEIGIMF